MVGYAWTMTILTISAAAHAAGIDRRTLQRAIKSGRLSATANAAGERGIDLAELIRVFGSLREMPQEPPQGQSAAMSQNAPGDAAGAALLETLQNQVRQAQEQLRQAHEREQQGQQEKARLLSLLEAEQQTRHDLETKLLPVLRPAPTGKDRLWALVVFLFLALAVLVVTLVRPDLVGRLTSG